MYRIGLAVLGLLLLACGGSNEKEKETTGDGEDSSRASFSNRFQPASLPYQLTDTSLLKNTDTATLRGAFMQTLIPDSTTKKTFRPQHRH